MDWTKVVASLEHAASEHQDKANLFATQSEKDRKQRAVQYDVSADLLRSLAKALRRGIS